MSKVALIVDDEADLCRLMQITLTKMNIKSDVAYNLADAFQLFDSNQYDFCLTDLALPDGSGLDMVKKVTSSGKNTPIAVITAHGTVDLAIEALKIGAFDFVNKPLELSRLRLLVENALKAADTNNSPESSISAEDQLLNERLIGVSEPMQSLRSTIKRLAKSQAPVFLWGASGTGKEVVARLIHDLSPRKEGSFVPVNCGAIPSELMESEFFGHKKGSFTGATTDKIGLFQQANGGTLFLDEVADLPLAMQVKLLRAIQEKTVRAIGDTKEVPVDVRILSATHKDLNQLVNQGLFRQDLFYRINVILVRLPKLNERRKDIKLLADHFLKLIAKDWQIDMPVLTDDAIAALQSHDFEGNVRELRNLLERAVTMTDDNQITAAALSYSEFFDSKPIESPYQNKNAHTPSFQTDNTALNTIKISANYGTPSSSQTNRPFVKSNEADMPSYDAVLDFTDEMDDEQDEPITLMPETQVNTNALGAHTLNAPTLSMDDVELPAEGLESYLQNQERTLIVAALTKANGNKTQAAKLLGMTFRSLRYRMKKLELDGSDDDTDGEEI